MKIKTLFVAALCASALTQAHAHQIWIEPAAKGYTLHFGEYDENLKEVSPGLLDKMPAPVAVSVLDGQEKPISPLKGKDAYALDTKLGKAGAIVAEVRNYPVFERKNGEQVIRGKWVPAARYVVGHEVQSPKTMLDIVPNGAPGKFKLFYRDQPLAKTKLTLVAPNGWQKQLQSDENGEFEVETLWRGDYVIEVAHKDATSGEIDGDKYDNVSFTTTLSFTETKGSKTPRPEAAKPNQMK